MVDAQIVLETVSRMRASGISDELIRSTLSDIGLSKTEIVQYLKPATATTVAKPAVEVHTKTAFSPAVQPAAEENLEDDDASGFLRAAPGLHEEALHTTTHVALDVQNQQLAEVSKRLEELNSKLSKSPAGSTAQLSDSVARLDKKISAFENEFQDTKTQMAAFKTVLEKILETNREILTELQEKK